MYIHEAVATVNSEAPFITREAWRGILTERPCTAAIKIQPTNTPDLCIIESVVDRRCGRGWQPSADDLMADDWVLTT